MSYTRKLQNRKLVRLVFSQGAHQAKSCRTLHSFYPRVLFYLKIIFIIKMKEALMKSEDHKAATKEKYWSHGA